MIDWLKRRVANLLIGAIVDRDQPGATYRVQLAGRADEIKGGIEVLMPYGLAFRLLPAGGDDGPETVALAIEPDWRVALPPDDRRHRPADLQPGEVMLFDDQGQRVYLTRDGIDVVTPKRYRVFCEDYEIHASRSYLLNVGGYAEKLTHVSEGQLLSEIWHSPAQVTAADDAGYKYPTPAPG